LFYSNSSSWETEYGSVLGYLKTLNENLHDLRRIMIDQTGVGETFMSMAINSGLENARGIGTVLAEETGCYDFPQALYGGWTSPHTLRHGVHERAQRRALWAGDYRETKVLASTGDP